jgi:hypothetical protein
MTAIRPIVATGLMLVPLADARGDEPRPTPGRSPERVRLSPDRRGFSLEPSGRRFVPWGFNYDHDEKGRLLEDYWENEWQKVVEDFREMSELGANVVRIHLQFGRFMKAADRPDEPSLDRLDQLLSLAEKQGLYLDLTGLGCYHKPDVPPWYDALDEAGRWKAQAEFWRAIAARAKDSPAVFCYDLMNEPVVPGDPPRKAGDWLGPPFAGKHFVQCITLGQNDRPRPEIARMWIETLTEAIRSVDPDHLITVGMVDWSLDRPGLTSGFVPGRVAGPLDFLCVHLYPEAGKVDAAVETLKGFVAAGKPVVIEETFPLRSGIDDFRSFLERTRPIASGWVGFYWGRTREECRKAGTISDAITAQWLDVFVEHTPRFRRP